VIDTVGVKIGPFATVDWYGTPFTKALHVVERQPSAGARTTCIRVKILPPVQGGFVHHHPNEH
jgi:hypothetical protein